MKIVFTYISFLLSLTVFSQTGLIVNEVSQGNSGVREYVELVVIAPTGTCTVDIRGWVIDDHNGDYSTSGPVTAAGIASGHFRFTNDPQWQAVPTGSIILIYNAADKNASITLPDDPTDSNNDRVYILPHNSSLILESCTTAPATGNASYTCTYSTPPGAWSPLGLSNDGDVMQVRTPTYTHFHGLAFGDGGCDCIDTAPPGGVIVDPCTAGGCTGGRVYFFDNTPSNDYTLAANFTIGSAGVNETPGATNNAANNTWRNTLLCPLPLPAVTLKGEVINNQAVLQYFINEEERVSNLYLEHLTGTQPWEVVSEMKHSNSFVYTLHDNENHYFRIRFEDKDGNTKISNIVTARSNNLSSPLMNIYPNPASNYVNVTFQQPDNGYLQVYDYSAKLVYQTNIESTNYLHIVDTQSWQDGLYMIRYISQKGTVLTQNILKQLTN